MTYSRYAIYYVPDPGPLTDFAAQWLGWDILTGGSCSHPLVSHLPCAVEKITATPRKYGFHATIKPPFRLAPGCSPDELRDAARTLMASLAPVTLNGLQVSQIGNFLALTPVGDTGALNQLAAGTVKDLDQFRAPADSAELARRRAAHLSESQEALLIKWGYPYVMEEFRFHMTLSGRLSAQHLAQVADALRPELTPRITGSHPIRSLCLVGERPDRQFELIERLPII